MEDWLGQANITVNKNMVPRDTRKSTVTSGIRIGTSAVTTRGMDEADMRLIAGWIALILRKGESAVPSVKEEVLELTRLHLLYR